MPNLRVSVEGLWKGKDQIQANVVVFRKELINGEEQEVPIGEKSITFSTTLIKDEVIPIIKAAAKEIIAIAREAKTTREELNKALETEVIE